MSQANQYFDKLEGWGDLEVSIIKQTKINKVLKAIIKLSSIPSDAEYNFKDRALALLDSWNQSLANDPEASGTEPTAKENGVNSTSTNAANDSKTDSEGDKEKGKSTAPAAGATSSKADELEKSIDEKTAEKGDTLAEEEKTQSEDKAIEDAEPESKVETDKEKVTAPDNATETKEDADTSKPEVEKAVDTASEA